MAKSSSLMRNSRQPPKAPKKMRKRQKANKTTPNRPIQGAKRHQNTLGDKFGAWRAHHRESSRDALKRLTQHPISTLTTLLMLALALALPAGLSLVLQNIEAVSADWAEAPHMSVFLDKSVSPKAQNILAQQWQSRYHLNKVEVITADQALAEYKQFADSNAIVAALPENPLPPVIVLYPHDGSASDMLQLQQQLKHQPRIDKVVLDVDWVRKFNSFMGLAQRLVSVLTLALALGVVLVINNTLQLAIDSRRSEIVVMKTVGGTDGFVRRPFLYSGFWYGVGGGLLALGLIGIVFIFVGQYAKDLLQLFNSHQRLIGLPFYSILLVPLLSGFLGLLGAYFAVSRHIDDIDPGQF